MKLTIIIFHSTRHSSHLSNVTISTSFFVTTTTCSTQNSLFQPDEIDDLVKTKLILYHTMLILF